MPVVSARRKNIIVGIDFGTSTTKAVWHDTSADAYEVMRWLPAKTGINGALLPSELAVHDGRIWMGHAATELDGAPLRIPWIKICVLCEVNPSVCRHCAHARGRGRIGMPDGTVVSARALACAFLSYVFGAVEADLRRRHPGETLHLTWNVGCPIDHMDKSQACRNYEAMAQVAWEMRGSAKNPMSIEAARALDAKLHTAVVPEQSQRSVFVRPETHAGVMAFLQSPHATERTYVLVDIGAGTTDVSMFIHGRNRGEAGAPFYSNYLGDGTTAVGGDDIDRELAGAWGVDLEAARQRKERGENIPPRIETVDRIHDHYKSVCVRVVDTYMLVAPADLRYDLFSFGGGSRLQAVKGSFGRPLPRNLSVAKLQKLTPPRELKRFPGLVENYDLLAVACGLSSTILDWDRIMPRTRVRPMEHTTRRPSRVRERPDRDELYPP